MKTGIFKFVQVIITTVTMVCLIQIINRTNTFTRLIFDVNNTNTTASNRIHFDYYICTQVWNETNEHLVEWIEHQLFRLGFRNICVISVEEPLDKEIVVRYRLATITKAEHEQEWKYCLECFTNPPMKPQDLIMLQVSPTNTKFYFTSHNHHTLNRNLLFL